MAKVNIEYDTVSKKMSCSMDGKTLGDISSVSLYQYKNYDGEMECSVAIQRCGKDMDNKMSWCETTYAALQNELEYVSVEEKASDNKLTEDMVKYFKGI